MERENKEGKPVPLLITHQQEEGTGQQWPLIPHSNEVILYSHGRDRASSVVVVYDNSQNKLVVHKDSHRGGVFRNRARYCPLCQHPFYRPQEAEAEEDAFDEEDEEQTPKAFVNDNYFKILTIAYGNEMSSNASEGTDFNDQGGLNTHTFNTGYYSQFFKNEKKIASGGFGSVYVSDHSLDGVSLGTYAVKKVPVGDSRKRLRRVLKEVKLLERLRHKNIVHYKHSWLEKAKESQFCPEVPCLFILMEYANAGTLKDLIWPKQETDARKIAVMQRKMRREGRQLTQNEDMSEESVWGFLIQILNGMLYLARVGIIHRDLKPENLLLTTVDADNFFHRHLEEDEKERVEFMSDSSSTSSAYFDAHKPDPETIPLHLRYRVMISDFGESRIKGVHYTRSGNTGTLAYSAPEMLFANKVDSSSQTSTEPKDRDIHRQEDEKGDVWSLGVIMYALAFSVLPFDAEDIDELSQQINKGLMFPANHTRSQELVDFISKVLTTDPSSRPSLDDIISSQSIVVRDLNSSLASLQSAKQRSLSPFSSPGNSPVQAPSFSLSPSTPVRSTQSLTPCSPVFRCLEFLGPPVPSTLHLDPGAAVVEDSDEDMTSSSHNLGKSGAIGLQASPVTPLGKRAVEMVHVVDDDDDAEEVVQPSVAVVGVDQSTSSDKVARIQAESELKRLKDFMSLTMREMLDKWTAYESNHRKCVKQLEKSRYQQKQLQAQLDYERRTWQKEKRQLEAALSGLKQATVTIDATPDSAVIQ